MYSSNIVHKNRDRPIKMQKSIEFLALYNSLNIALECPGRFAIKSCTLIERWKRQVFWGLNRSKIFYTLSPIHMSHVVIIIASCRSCCKKYIIISKKHLSFLLWILVVQPIYQKDLKMALWILSASYSMFFLHFIIRFTDPLQTISASFLFNTICCMSVFLSYKMILWECSVLKFKTKTPKVISGKLLFCATKLSVFFPIHGCSSESRRFLWMKNWNQMKLRWRLLHVTIVMK